MLAALPAAGSAAGAAFPWAAAAGLGGGIVNALLGGASAKKQSSAMKNAAQAQQIAAQRGGSAALALQQPQFEVGQSALATLAAIYGLPAPTMIDVGQIRQELSPTGENLVSLGGTSYYDPKTGQRYQMAVKGANAGEFIRVPGTYGSPNQYAQGNAAAPTSGPSDFSTLNALIENNPGIQFINQQNQKRIAQQNAARGRFLSGAQTKDAIDYSTNAAATNWQNVVLDPLFTLAGYTRPSSQAGGNIINQMTTNVGNALGAQGAARASGYAADTGIQANLIDDLINYGGDIANWYRNRG